MDGIFNVRKPMGMTSHDVVSAMRKILGIKKIGHGGTLDPLAEGVLPVFAGKATRFIEYAVEGHKVYRATISFGQKTDTGDREGKVIATGPIHHVAEEDLQAALACFLGKISQIPPMYSALSQGGKKLYKLAREGIVVERAPREIFIYALHMISYNDRELVIEVECSKGTYIRTLAEDIATKLGMVGFMSALLRQQVGSFKLAESATLEEIAKEPEKYVLPLETALADFPTLVVNPLQGRRIAQGVATTIKNIVEGTTYKICTDDQQLVGLAKAEDGKLRGTKIINVPEDASNNEDNQNS